MPGHKPYSKKHWKYLLEVVPKNNCNICNVTAAKSSTKRLVWDHDHDTGFIRGVLCDLCNCWLPFYEFIKKYEFMNAEKVYGRTCAYWMVAYKDKIEIHLSSNTGILYSDKKPKIK